MKLRSSDTETQPGPFARVRGLFREPFVSFVLVGALVFGVDRALQKDTRTIRLTPSVRDEITRVLNVQLGRPPDAQETQRAIEGWKREQALFREGVKMGLLEQDPSIRAHVVAKLLEIARERDVFPQPAEAELRSYLEQHRSAYTVPPTFDFEQVFISQTRSGARAQAEQILAELRQGASSDTLGDPFPRGHRFNGETLSDVAMLLGDRAANEMPRYAVGEWNLVEAPQGYHAVRVTGGDRGEPNFERLRPALEVAFDAERRDAAAQAFAREIEGRYRFVNSE